MHCSKCGKQNSPKVSFCIDCGNQLKGGKIDFDDSNKKYFTQSIVLFGIIVLIISASIRGISQPLIVSEIIFQSLFALVTIIFVLFDYKNFFKLFKLQLNLKPIIQIIVGAPVIAVLVVVLAHFINTLTDIPNSNYFDIFSSNTTNGYLYGLIFVSLLPGLVEEMLFRGILFNHLLRFSRPKITILISSILFSFIHFSVISLPWLFSIGMILGYFRFRYRTIWYGIFFHMLYNASVFLIEPILYQHIFH